MEEILKLSGEYNDKFKEMIENILNENEDYQYLYYLAYIFNENNENLGPIFKYNEHELIKNKKQIFNLIGKTNKLYYFFKAYFYYYLLSCYDIGEIKAYKYIFKCDMSEKMEYNLKKITIFGYNYEKFYDFYFCDGINYALDEFYEEKLDNLNNQITISDMKKELKKLKAENFKLKMEKEIDNLEEEFNKI